MQMANLNMITVTTDNETKKLIDIFKTVVDKEKIANILAIKPLLKV